MKSLHAIAFILVIVGSLNWLVIGLFNIGGIADFIGFGLAKVVYVIVGVAAIYLIVTHKKTCSTCCASGDAGTSSV